MWHTRELHWRCDLSVAIEDLVEAVAEAIWVEGEDSTITGSDVAKPKHRDLGAWETTREHQETDKRDIGEDRKWKQDSRVLRLLWAAFHLHIRAYHRRSVPAYVQSR
jgi:hypothetical protein